MARLGAGVRKRADGSFEKRFTVNGKRYSVYGKSTKEIAQKEQDIRKQINAGVYTDNRNITLDGYFDEWVKSKRNNVKGNSLRSYKSCYKNHISPKIGSRKVQKIERREITKLQTELSETLSINSVNYIISVLNIVLNDAVMDEVIVRNPASGIKTLKNEEPKANETYHRALTEDEQKAFMQEMQEDYYYEFVALLLCTGMRIGEAAALTWGDIDQKNNVIHVNKTATYSENGSLIVGNTPKSEAGKRDIPMNDTIKGVLRQQRSKLGKIYPMNNNNVFLSVYGCLITNNAINRSISSALKRLECKGMYIEHFTAHALRDTFATRFIEQGGQPQTLKTILGHSSLAMTMDLYSHVLPNTKQKEMNAINIAI